MTKSVGWPGIIFNEIYSKVVPPTNPGRRLTSDPLKVKTGATVTPDTTIIEIRESLELGAIRQTAPSRVVFRRFLSEYPEASSGNKPRDAVRFDFAGQGVTGDSELIESGLITVRANDARARIPSPTPGPSTKVGHRLSIDDANREFQFVSCVIHSNNREKHIRWASYFQFQRTAPPRPRATT